MKKWFDQRDAFFAVGLGAVSYGVATMFGIEVAAIVAGLIVLFPALRR